MQLDYEKLGFKAGIEIHQELNTKKLFCNCDSTMEENKETSVITRKLRAVAGETGEIDLASAYEQIRDRDFAYHSYSNESCLVEQDDEPPHPVNKEAFGIALGVCRMMKLKVPDTICFMRKTVTDGSATSGFQRTGIVGMAGKDSFLETPLGKVKVMQLNLEEDSCRIIKKEHNTVHYSLSRLGVPLIEIGTDASIKNPEHVKEVALEIGTLIRSFKVKRGIGTIRQDVNVSIKGGARVEVKGWQDLKKLEELVRNEVFRQVNLIEVKRLLETRGVAGIGKSIKDVTDIFRKAESKIISDMIHAGGKVYALLLPGFAGLLKMELCPGKTFGRELSEYAKAYGTKGMIHTDEDLSRYKLEKEFNELRMLFNSKPHDLIVIVAEKEDVAKKAIDAVYERALYSLKGVPEETRIPNHNDATSSYARPLPGAHRLYPETDIPNILVTKDILKSIKLPELVPEKIERLVKEYGVNKDISREIVREGLDFEGYVKRFKNVEPKFIAQALVEMPKEIKKRYNADVDIEKYAPAALEKLNGGSIAKEAVFEILSESTSGKIDYSKYRMLSDAELESVVKKLLSENKNLPFNAAIGKVMEKLRGRADGKKIVELIKKGYK